MTLTELRRIAMGATKGPWVQGTYDGEIMPWVCDDSGVEIARTSMIRAVDEDHIQNAAHIAAFHPQQAIALLDMVEELRTELERFANIGLDFISKDDPFRHMVLKAREALEKFK